jgi:hypothetical protein
LVLLFCNNSYIKNTRPYEGTIDNKREEYLTPVQITDNPKFKLFRVPNSMTQNINKIDYKARYFSIIVYDLQTNKIFEHDSK